MNLGKLGQVITGKEIFDLIHEDVYKRQAKCCPPSRLRVRISCFT